MQYYTTILVWSTVCSWISPDAATLVTMRELPLNIDVMQNVLRVRYRLSSVGPLIVRNSSANDTWCYDKKSNCITIARLQVIPCQCQSNIHILLERSYRAYINSSKNAIQINWVALFTKKISDCHCRVSSVNGRSIITVMPSIMFN